MSEIARFPRLVTIQVVHSDPEGLAVNLTFHMRTRNHFHYVVFLNAHGIATVSAESALKCFDEERTAFIADYVDPRVGFTGEISADVMSRQALAKADSAFRMFREHLKYPDGYEQKLQYAITRVPIDVNYRVSITLEECS